MYIAMDDIVHHHQRNGIFHRIIKINVYRKFDQKRRFNVLLHNISGALFSLLINAIAFSESLFRLVSSML